VFSRDRARAKAASWFRCLRLSRWWAGSAAGWTGPQPGGVPAHVTILYPFVLPEAITPLTTALHAAFPQYPPFGGIYPDVVPRLTIGARPPGGPATLEAAEAEVWPALPVRTFVSRAWLMTGTQAAASWRVAAEFPPGA
jgi:hypothetical protein